MNSGKIAEAAKEATAQAGKIVHKITAFRVVPVIPAKWVIKEFKDLARPMPAPKGYYWYVIQGTVTNKSNESRFININTFKIVDSAGKKYLTDPKTSLYQPQETLVAHIDVGPGQKNHGWLFFLFRLPPNNSGAERTCLVLPGR